MGRTKVMVDGPPERKPFLLNEFLLLAAIHGFSQKACGICLEICTSGKSRIFGHVARWPLIVSSRSMRVHVIDNKDTRCRKG